MESVIQSATKIVLTGPESTGKTTLSSLLALGYKEPWVQEYARDYLESRNGVYEYEDLDHIARNQIKHESHLLPVAKHFLFCDTDILTIITWGLFRFNKTENWMVEEFIRPDNKVYMLCDIDVPWVPDPLRVNPDDRKALYNLHLEWLERHNRSYVNISGTQEQRIKTLISFLDSEKL